MLYATLNMSDLVHDTHKLNDRLGTGNTDVDYESAVAGIIIEEL